MSAVKPVVSPSVPDAACSAALTALAEQVDAYNVGRMRNYLARAMPELLGIDPARVAITIDVGNDTIGIAAQSRSGSNAATSGAKADCVATPQKWAADRCGEIIAQWAPMDAQATQAKATVSA
jgi:hypothetical protein